MSKGVNKSGLMPIDQDLSLIIPSQYVTATSTHTLTNKTLTTPIISTISNTGTLTLPTSTTTLVGRDTTDTLTNKTLTTPIISTISNTGTLTLPTSTTTLVGRDTTDTLTNKTFNDTTFIIQNNTDNTKKIKFDCSSVSTGQTYTITVPSLPSFSGNLVFDSSVQTLTNKTLTSPTISTILNSGTITLPTLTTTLVGRDTTDTLTNKTLTSPTISTIQNGGATLTLPTNTTTLVGTNTISTLTLKTIDACTFTGTHSGTFYTSGLNYNINTTDSTSTTSNSALKTDGGLSVAKNIYGLNIFGNNELTSKYIISVWNSTTQSITKATQTDVVFNTEVHNPSSATTYISTVAPSVDGFTLNKTGYYLLNFNTFINLANSDQTFVAVWLTRPGVDYDYMIYKSVTNNASINSTDPHYLSWCQVRYFSSGQRLAVSIYLNTTGAGPIVIGSYGNTGTKTRLTAIYLGS